MVGVHQARIWRVVVAGSVLPGVVLGHLVAYTLAYPSASARAQHLEHSGHGALALLTVGAFVMVPVVLVVTAGWSLRTVQRLPARAVATRMATLQTVAFVSLEVAERGFGLASAITDPAVLVGAALQLPLAVCAAYLLAGFVVVVRRLPSVRPLWLAAVPGPVSAWSVHRPEALPAVQTLHRVPERGPPAAVPA